MRLTRTLAALTVAAVAGGTVGGGEVASAADPGVFTVYMDTQGSDADDGRTPQRAVRTLERVEEILRGAQPATDVEVRIDQGTYVAGQTTWQFYVPGHTISFLPIGYDYGGVEQIAGRPRFLGAPGDANDRWWLRASLPAGHPGGTTGLRFYYLTVERYAMGAVRLGGGEQEDASGIRRPATAGMNGNTFFGMWFEGLGTRYAGGSYGYAAIDLVNSRDNLVRNNHFVELEDTGGQFHAVYLAHHSSGNTVRNNRFAVVSGDPVRARNDSNHNDVFGNRFNRTGWYAFYSQWFCDTECADENDQGLECASHGNRFRDNQVTLGHDGEPQPAWRLFPPDQSYEGGAPGCDNEGEPRLSAWGNT